MTPIVITQYQDRMWKVQKGKMILTLNLANDKLRWLPESRVTIDDAIAWPTLTGIEDALFNLK